MKSLTARMGLWSSIIGLFSFVVYTVAFVGIALTNPAFAWTDMDAFVAYSQSYSQFFKYLAMAFMLVYGISYVVQVTCAGEYIDKSKRVLARLGASFALGFALLTGINYFIQLTAVRLQIVAGQGAGLAQWVMSYPISVVAAINMLGWTVFMGLASLCTAFCFGKAKGERACRRAFFANGVVMLIGCIGYVTYTFIVTFLCMYLGLGATVFAMTIAQWTLYKRRLSGCNQ